MQPDGTYPVLRCGRCSLIHPHGLRLCPRCGASSPRLAHVDRQQAERAALDFLVPATEITLPQEMVAQLHDRPRTAHASDALARRLAALGTRMQTAAWNAYLRPAGAVRGLVASLRSRV